MEYFQSLRTDLAVTSFTDEQGVLFFDVKDPETKQVLRLYDVEWLIAETLSTTGDPDQARTVSRRLFDYAPTNQELTQLMEHLEKWGLCITKKTQQPSPIANASAVDKQKNSRISPQPETRPAVQSKPSLESDFKQKPLQPAPPVIQQRTTTASKSWISDQPVPLVLPTQLKPSEPALSPQPVIKKEHPTGNMPTRASLQDSAISMGTSLPPTSVTNQAQPSVYVEPPQLRSRSWIPIFFLLTVLIAIVYVVYLVLSSSS